MSPKDPLPIFRTSRYLLPTMNSDFASLELDISNGSRLFMNSMKKDAYLRVYKKNDRLEI